MPLRSQTNWAGGGNIVGELHITAAGWRGTRRVMLFPRHARVDVNSKRLDDPRRLKLSHAKPNLPFRQAGGSCDVPYRSARDASIPHRVTLSFRERPIRLDHLWRQLPGVSAHGRGRNLQGRRDINNRHTRLAHLDNERDNLGRELSRDRLEPAHWAGSAASDARRSIVTPACAAPSAFVIATHRLAGMLSRCAQYATVFGGTPICAAILAGPPKARMICGTSIEGIYGNAP